jgi:polyribonucleotide nucleotidyltransferase
MTKCYPHPARQLSKYASLINVLKVNPGRLNLIISSGRTLKNIIEDTGVDSIEVQPNGLVMVPTVGGIYRNCEVKSIVAFGAFVEIAPARESPKDENLRNNIHVINVLKFGLGLKISQGFAQTQLRLGLELDWGSHILVY